MKKISKGSQEEKSTEDDGLISLFFLSCGYKWYIVLRIILVLYISTGEKRRDEVVTFSSQKERMDLRRKSERKKVDCARKLFDSEGKLRESREKSNTENGSEVGEGQNPNLETGFDSSNLALALILPENSSKMTPKIISSEDFEIVPSGRRVTRSFNAKKSKSTQNESPKKKGGRFSDSEESSEEGSGEEVNLAGEKPQKSSKPLLLKLPKEMRGRWSTERFKIPQKKSRNPKSLHFPLVY